MKKSMILMRCGSRLDLIPGSASAASYTFNINSSLKASPAGTDTNGLDHHLAYAWNMSGFNLGSQTITGASITFTNIHNWDNNANKLFVYIAAYVGLHSRNAGRDWQRSLFVGRLRFAWR